MDRFLIKILENIKVIVELNTLNVRVHEIQPLVPDTDVFRCVWGHKLYDRFIKTGVPNRFFIVNQRNYKRCLSIQSQMCTNNIRLMGPVVWLHTDTRPNA